MSQEALPEITALVPPRSVIEGRFAKLRPLQSSDGSDLYRHLGGSQPSTLWRFMPDGPYADQEALHASIARKMASNDPLFFAVAKVATDEVVGIVAFLRIDLNHRTIELGHIIYSPAVQRTPVTTEVIYLMLQLVFESLNFRRCEWKCDNLNEPSKRAAQRFGFQFEGVFRQHYIVKGRNRDTAWFSMLDREWPAVKASFQRWLNADNFDSNGQQLQKLLITS